MCWSGTEAMSSSSCCPIRPLTAAVLMGERIRAAVAAYPWSRLARGLDAHISVGVAEHLPGMTYDEVMSAADSALHRAKELGRDQVAVA